MNTTERIKDYLDSLHKQEALSKKWYNEDIGNKDEKTIKEFNTESSANQRKLQTYESEFVKNIENIIKDSDIDQIIFTNLISEYFVAKGQYVSLKKIAKKKYPLVQKGFELYLENKNFMEEGNMIGQVHYAYLFMCNGINGRTINETSQEDFLILIDIVIKVSEYANIPGIVKKPKFFAEFSKNKLILERALFGVDQRKWTTSAKYIGTNSLFLFWALIYILLLSKKKGICEHIEKWVKSDMKRSDVYLLNKFLAFNKKEDMIGKLYETFAEKYSEDWRETYANR